MQLKKLLTLSVLFLTMPAFAGGGKAKELDYSPGTYTIDTAHTRAAFSIHHFMISMVEGRFNKVTGSVTLNKDFEKSTFAATIPVSSVDTAVDKRDNHLKSPDFFDAKKYPEMKFATTSIEGSRDDFKLKGNLSIKDVTKEVTFKGKFLGSVKDSWGNTRIAYKLKTKIKRSDFNINYNGTFDLGPVVGDEVKIHIISEATLNK